MSSNPIPKLVIFHDEGRLDFIADVPLDIWVIDQDEPDFPEETTAFHADVTVNRRSCHRFYGMSAGENRRLIGTFMQEGDGV